VDVVGLRCRRGWCCTRNPEPCRAPILGAEIETLPSPRAGGPAAHHLC